MVKGWLEPGQGYITKRREEETDKDRDSERGEREREREEITKRENVSKF